jgi:enamine deaminase RidA (YjgF/YER057c/UK114 family)
MNPCSLRNHEVYVSRFQTDQSSSINCLTINGQGDSPAGAIIRNEAEKLKTVILKQIVFADKSWNGRLLHDVAAEETPSACIYHALTGTSGIFSAQAIALSGNHDIKTVSAGWKKIGLVHEDRFARYCHLSNVFAQNISLSRPEQTRAVFEIFQEALRCHGFNFTDTVRTWFYNDRITEWYGEFNKVRTDFFNKAGVFEHVVPASTGIGAGNPHGAALTGSLLAVQPKNGLVKIQAVPSPMQESALEYKSSFSRAVETEYPSCRCLYISGTASISKEGKTLYINDIDSQVKLTMSVAENLLQSRAMNWKNVFRGIVYFKRPDYLEHFKKYCRIHDISISNLAIAFTDMCRDDLLFEIELDAISSKASLP